MILTYIRICIHGLRSVLATVKRVEGAVSMKKVMAALIVVLELLYILSGCSGSLAESSSSATAESVYVAYE